jgi:hypothetical protein
MNAQIRLTVDLGAEEALDCAVFVLRQILQQRKPGQSAEAVNVRVVVAPSSLARTAGAAAARRCGEFENPEI